MAAAYYNAYFNDVVEIHKNEAIDRLNRQMDLNERLEVIEEA